MSSVKCRLGLNELNDLDPISPAFSRDRYLTGSQYIDGLVQERRNSSALAMELRFSCSYPSTWSHPQIRCCALFTRPWRLLSSHIGVNISADILPIVLTDPDTDCTLPKITEVNTPKGVIYHTSNTHLL